MSGRDQPSPSCVDPNGRSEPFRSTQPDRVDLAIVNARLLALMDGAGTELAGGWVAITDGLVSGVGAGPAPEATATLDATDCLVTPGLVNTHHHLYQNLTRAFPR